MILENFDQTIFKNLKCPIIVIYDGPSDFPNQHVARLFDLDSPTLYHVVKNSYEDIAKAIPEHMQRLERNPNDDPVIVEMWI